MDARQNQRNGMTEGTQMTLRRGAAARLENAIGTRVRVESGGVWVTHERCRDDVVVNSGETYTIDRDGATVVASLGRGVALVTIESPAPVRTKHSLVERVGSLWRGLQLHAMPAPRG